MANRGRFVQHERMAEFKDTIPHTGGVLTIHKQGQTYSLSYVHMSQNRVALAELIAVDGNAVDFARPTLPEVR